MNLATKTDPQSLRGRILTHLAGPSESSGDAVMLKSDTSSVTGLAWAFLDETCRLHYNIRLEGGAGAGLELETAASTLELEDYPIHKADNLKVVPQIDPSVPQPVVQSRRRPLLGPSPG